MPAKRIPVFAFLNKYEKGRSATNEITGVGGAGLLSICPTPTKKTKKKQASFCETVLHITKKMLLLFKII